jgi:two-component system cell cycle response regulator
MVGRDAAGIGVAVLPDQLSKGISMTHVVTGVNGVADRHASAPAGLASAVVASRVLWSFGLLVVLAHSAYTALGVGKGSLDWIGSPWTACVVFVICTAVSVARGLAHRRERTAWFVLAAGLALYALSQPFYVLVTAKDSSPAFPAISDVLMLAMYPFALIAIVLLVRSQRSRARADLWLDGVIGGLAVASLGVVVIFSLVIDPAEALQASPANLAYTLGDLLVIGFGTGACALLGWRAPRALVVLIVGFAALVLQDVAYLSALINGTYVPGTFVGESCWLLALLLITAAAAWPRPVRELTHTASPNAVVAFPFLFGLLAVGLAGYLALSTHTNVLPVALTMLTLVAVVVRFALTFRAHLTILAITERDAITDALTGLGNRRKLLRDADLAVAQATAEHPLMLAIFDLDGFKTYNDTYGHPAGDALLARLSAKLVDAVAGWGSAYRLGGDEFCLLLPGDSMQRRQALAAAIAALSEDGEAFSIGSSYGTALVPSEAGDATEALRCADQRLYAAKDNRPDAPVRQACDALRQILLESEPDLDDHHDVVGRLVEAVARKLGIAGDALSTVTRAAELHDIGKIAIPDAILHKPGPLTDEEWRFMRRHTTIGERFLASIPALRVEAGLVRASHERYDGGGYPDGLAAEEIPLGARIIFACDAYHAMTTDRPYRTGMSHDEGLVELRRHAGTQFDPAVIEALCATLTPELVRDSALTAAAQRAAAVRRASHAG